MKKNILLALLISAVGSMYAGTQFPTIDEVRKEFNVVNILNDFQNGTTAFDQFKNHFPKDAPKLKDLIDRSKRGGLTALEQSETECKINQYAVYLVDAIVGSKYEEISKLATNGAENIHASFINGSLRKFVEQQKEQVKDQAKNLGIDPITLESNKKPDGDPAPKSFLQRNRNYIIGAAVVATIIGVYYWMQSDGDAQETNPNLGTM